MTSDEFDRWSTEAVAGFAAQLTDSGSLPAGEAAAYAAEQHVRLLADGIATPNHHFWTAVDEGRGQPVGHLWHCVRPRGGCVESFVYDVSVHDSLRGQGWGRGVMLAGESAARALGATVSRLNVFGHNAAATALYGRLGYVVETVMMRLHVDVTDPGPRDAGEAMPGVETVDDEALDGIRLELTRRPDGLHALVHGLAVGESLDAAATRRLLGQLRRLGRERCVNTLELPFPGADKEARRTWAAEGLVVTAQLMSKQL